MQMLPPINDTARTALATVGAAAIACKALKLMAFAYRAYLRPTPNLAAKYKKAGSWAVVTGASDGIGRAMAVDLAKRGFNIVLIARTKSKLEAAAEEVLSFGVEAKVISFDFGNADADAYAGLFAELDTVPIGVLVNNVGINYDTPEFFEQKEYSVDASIVNVNITSQLQMTKYIVPKFKAAKCGAIVNLSSVSCLIPTPLLSVYAATKAFNKCFSDSLRGELYTYNVDVLTVTPGFVCSAMSQRKKPTFDCVAADAMARQTLSALPSNSTTFGHRNHSVIFSILGAMPAWVQHKVIFGSGLSIRTKVAKRKAKAEAAAAMTA